MHGTLRNIHNDATERQVLTYSIAEARMRLLNIMTNGLIRLLNGHMGNKGTVALVDPSVELHEVVE